MTTEKSEQWQTKTWSILRLACRLPEAVDKNSDCLTNQGNDRSMDRPTNPEVSLIELRCARVTSLAKKLGQKNMKRQRRNESERRGMMYVKR